MRIFIYDLIVLLFAFLISIYIIDDGVIINALGIFGMYKIIDSFSENIIKEVDKNERANNRKHIYFSRRCCALFS